MALSLLEVIVASVVAVGLSYGLNIYLGFRAATRSINNLPGYRKFFAPDSFISIALPPTRGISLSATWMVVDRREPFERAGCDVTAVVSAWPKPKITFAIADPALIKEVSNSRWRFPKPLEQYSLLDCFGLNVVVSNGDDWRKYRKITAPSFSESNTRLVWDATVVIMKDMFKDEWNNADEYSVDHAVDLGLAIALLTVGVAGFGREISWKEEKVIPAGHKLTFKEALYIVTTQTVPKILLPEWALSLTPGLRRVKLGFEELELYMQEMITARKNGTAVIEREDLFSTLISANEDDDFTSDTTKLTDSEVIGNIFMFLVAGQETTAHTLAYTLALLALYPGEQEALHQHIMEVLEDPMNPTYEEMPRLTRVMAVVYETLRMFPPVPNIPKCSPQDTVFVVTNTAGERVSIPVPQGSDISIHVPALHYNPQYWEDPCEYKPDRFLKSDWPRDAFIPFSAGPRACLGRKFGETENVALLAMLITRYKIFVKPEPQYSHETFQQTKDRLLKSNMSITIAPERVPLVFKRR